MSFKCDICHQPQPRYAKPLKFVAETRLKKYPYREDKDGNIIDAGGTGQEIVKEQKLCSRCYINKLEAKLE